MPGNKDGIRQMRTIVTAHTSVAIDPAICDFIKNFSVGVQLDNVFITHHFHGYLMLPLI
jgi:hypothetical protein